MEVRVWLEGCVANYGSEGVCLKGVWLTMEVT